jgi:hypothetical protein
MFLRNLKINFYTIALKVAKIFTCDSEQGYRVFEIYLQSSVSYMTSLLTLYMTPYVSLQKQLMLFEHIKDKDFSELYIKIQFTLLPLFRHAVNTLYLDCKSQ